MDRGKMGDGNKIDRSRGSRKNTLFHNVEVFARRSSQNNWNWLTLGRRFNCEEGGVRVVDFPNKLFCTIFYQLNESFGSNDLKKFNASTLVLFLVLIDSSYAHIRETKHIRWIRKSLPKVIPWAIKLPVTNNHNTSNHNSRQGSLKPISSYGLGAQKSK